MIKGIAIGLFAGGVAALALTLARPIPAPFAAPVVRPTLARHTLEVFPEDRVAGPRLDRPVARFRFRDAPLSDVLDEFRRQSGVNVVVDWDDLADEGVRKETPVTVDLADLPASEVLRRTLVAARGRRGKPRYSWDTGEGIGFGLRNGVVMVGASEQAYLSPSSHGYLRVYDVRDLMLESARATRAILGNRPAAAPAAPQDAMEPTYDSMGRDRPPTAEAYAFEHLAEAMKSSIDPRSWHVTEGEGGDIHYWAGRLIVVQTLENHARVEAFLNELRTKLRPPAVASSAPSQK